MKEIQVGRPIQVDEKTASLLHLIAEGEWEKIDPEVLRSIVPDTNLFVRFLERHGLTHTAEAKVVLGRLGLEVTEPQQLARAAGGSNKSRDYRGDTKLRAAKTGAKRALKKLRVANRSKKTKSSTRSTSGKRNSRRGPRASKPPVLPA